MDMVLGLDVVTVVVVVAVVVLKTGLCLLSSVTFLGCFLIDSLSEVTVTAAALTAAAASLLSLVFLDGWLAEGGPWRGTPISLDLTQCMLMCLFKLNFVVKLFPQESQL